MQLLAVMHAAELRSRDVEGDRFVHYSCAACVLQNRDRPLPRELRSLGVSGYRCTVCRDVCPDPIVYLCVPSRDVFVSEAFSMYLSADSNHYFLKNSEQADGPAHILQPVLDVPNLETPTLTEEAFRQQLDTIAREFAARFQVPPPPPPAERDHAEGHLEEEMREVAGGGLHRLPAPSPTAPPTAAAV